jgi:protein-S-isoprenylcysteine O-methyltransferase Ste14
MNLTASKLAVLVGSGHKVGLVALPVAAVGLAVNIARPALFTVGGPPALLAAVAAVVLAAGLVVWAWSAVLIVTRVPRGELITTGPYAVVLHPLYTGVALLVLPWAGFLLDSWLGVVVGGALYAGSRLFSPEEEAELARTFGPAWDRYRASVALPWL